MCLCLAFLSYLCLCKTPNTDANWIKTHKRLSLIIKWMRACCINGPPYPHHITVWLNDWLMVADKSRFWQPGATVVAGMAQHLSCQLWGRAARWPSPQLRSCPWGQCCPDVGGHRSVSWLVDVLCFKLFELKRDVSWRNWGTHLGTKTKVFWHNWINVSSKCVKKWIWEGWGKVILGIWSTASEKVYLVHLLVFQGFSGSLLKSNYALLQSCWLPPLTELPSIQRVKLQGLFCSYMCKSLLFVMTRHEAWIWSRINMLPGWSQNVIL